MKIIACRMKPHCTSRAHLVPVNGPGGNWSHLDLSQCRTIEGSSGQDPMECQGLIINQNPFVVKGPHCDMC